MSLKIHVVVMTDFCSIVFPTFFKLVMFNLPCILRCGFLKSLS
jgi:hypothetical protein